MTIVVLFDEIAMHINRLNVVGVHADQFKLLVHFVLAFPLGIVLRYLRSPTIRKGYTIFWGIFFILYLGAQWIQLVMAQTLVIYLMRSLKRPFIPIATTSFLVLGYLHYDRIMNADSSWKMGFNVVQMMLTCRFVYVGVAAQDRLPFTFLDYMSYVFYFPNIIVGTVPFTAYIQFINLQGVYSNMGYKFNKAFQTLFKAILFVAADQLIRPKFSFAYFATQQWEEHSLFIRHIVCQLISCCERFKYFLAFNFSQASMDATGITYDGQEFSNYRLANYQFEIEFSPIKRTKHWNSSVQLWLQTCFYDRYKQHKSALLLTFVLSAYWHGFFIAYYVFFIEWAIFNEITKQVYRAKDKFKFIPIPIQKMICAIYGQLAVNSTATPIGLLKWDKVLKAMNDLGWVAQILMVVVWGFFKITKFGQSKKKE
ncbi:unnamed protein product [Paramecium sonneborni]|uniref:MBOAT family protein n=1 Tax=Paramecium sonneborni TaxID=65129 RepID=A0A8S1Q7R0_9CILI|nr:unnamed protein product [Paramecium sonneborni]